MDFALIIARLSANRAVFSALLETVSTEQARWRPAVDKWSLVEVINHLYDEERLDFRARLRLVLAGSEKKWPPIDPPRWVIERRYQERELVASLEQFLCERNDSLDWLKDLGEVDWNQGYDHASGRITAGDLMLSWLAHDLLHVRQMARLHWEFANLVGAPYGSNYAGPW